MSVINKIHSRIKKITQMVSARFLRRMPNEADDLTTDIRAAILNESPRGASTIIWLTLILLILALVWANNANVDEVTRAPGKVIPSSQIQIIQNLEGGILKEILVSEGSLIKKGDLLLRIDDTRFSGPFKESQVKYFAVKAKVARLNAEINGTPLEIPEEVREMYPDIANREMKLFLSRKEEKETELSILQERVIQQLQEQRELDAKKKQLSRTYHFINRELAMTKPLIADGAVSEVELLRLERQASQMKGELDITTLAIPRAESKHKEAVSAVKEKKIQYRNEARQALIEAAAILESLNVSSIALEDRLDRTSVKSPVHGIVNRILVNTLGGVIQPGMDMMEIVPLEDTLLVEARVSPKDIAFISAKQNAIVKFTSYDFTIYGGLEAEVEHISADSIIDEAGNSYYLVRVRTKKNYLGKEVDRFPIIPGMVTTVDILTGKKTILSYLIKPITRAKTLSLSER